MSERVPEGWTKTRLSEFSSARRGTTYAASELSEDKERYPLYINMKSFKVGGGYNERGDKYFSSPYSPGQIVRENDLLIANTDVTDACDILGAAVYLPREKLLEDVLFSHHVSALNIADDVDVNFLSFLFGSENSRLAMKRCGRGTTVKMLDMKDIGRICFSIPPLPEQKKIASILTSVDEVIETAQKQIDKLQDLKKATMNELLTKGIGHTEFKDSELGRIPKSWEVTNLEQYCSSVRDGTHESPKRTTTGYQLVTSKNLKSGKLDFSTCYNISNEDFHSINQRSKVDAFDILFGMIGTVGNPVVVQKNDLPFAIKNVALLKFDSDKNKSAWLFAYLDSSLCTQKIDKDLSGSTQSFISLGYLRNFNIPVPTALEQVQITKISAAINDQIQKYSMKLSQTQSLKKSLMQDLLTGKVRVQVN